MKKHNLTTLGLFILLFSISCTTTTIDKKVIHQISDNRGFSALIKIPGYTDTLKLMQITDSHLNLAVEEEADLTQYGERMHNAYLNPRKHFSEDISKTTFEWFDDNLQKAVDNKAGLLLLTGDIINFPSTATVKYLYDKITATGIPWLFISGNHDWHYEGLTGNPDSLREVWTKKSMLPLYNGLNPLSYSKIIKGINFVGIDNSTGHVNDDQVAFLQKQLDNPEPIIILSHIPYNFNNRASQAGMTAVVDFISSHSDRIIAIFTGHSHRTACYFTGNMCQYTTMASFQGASLLVSITPE